MKSSVEKKRLRENKILIKEKELSFRKYKRLKGPHVTLECQKIIFLVAVDWL